MLLMRAASIIWASGRGLGTGNLEFFGSQMALAYRLDAISQNLKNYRFPRSLLWILDEFSASPSPQEAFSRF
jgi:hypothetical protein